MKHFPDLETLTGFYRELDPDGLISVLNGQVLAYNTINHQLDVYELDSVRGVYVLIKD